MRQSGQAEAAKSMSSRSDDGRSEGNWIPNKYHVIHRFSPSFITWLLNVFIKLHRYVMTLDREYTEAGGVYDCACLRFRASRPRF
jgi:hypothetical protein